MRWHSHGSISFTLPPARVDSTTRIQHYGTVEKIFNSIQTETGVSLDWMDGKHKNSGHFSFPELADMRIRVPDLISNPELFRIDLQEHRIYVSQLGRGI
jgi:hypothetical protein